MLEAIFLNENLAFKEPYRPRRNPSVFCLAEFCPALLFVVFSLVIALILRSARVSNMQVKGMEIMTGKMLKSSSRGAQLETGVDFWGNADVLMAHDVCKAGRIRTSMRVFGDDVEVLFGTANVGQFAFWIDNAKAVLFKCIGKLLLQVPPPIGSYWKEKGRFICLPRRVGVLL